MINFSDINYLFSIQFYLSAPKSTSGTALRWTRIILTFAIENIVFLGLMYGSVKFFNLKLRPDWTIDSKIGMYLIYYY